MEQADTSRIWLPIRFSDRTEIGAVKISWIYFGKQKIAASWNLFLWKTTTRLSYIDNTIVADVLVA